MPKRFLPVLFLTCLCLTPAVFAQSFADAPQYVVAAGTGISSSPISANGWLGFGIKIAGGSYSYTRSDLQLKNSTPGQGYTMSSVLTTGVKQIVYQNGRITLAVDGGAGATIPTGNIGAALAATGGADVFFRLNYVQNTLPGSGNNYLLINPSVLTTTGVQGSTGLFVRIGWARSIN